MPSRIKLQSTFHPVHWCRSLSITLLLAFCGSLIAAPVYLSGDEAKTGLTLIPTQPPAELFTSSHPTENSSARWYRLDIELSQYSPHNWLMVFRPVPYKKLDVFIPMKGGYQLKKMGTDGSHSGIAPNTIKLALKGGETQTWYLRHTPAPLNPLLAPELWPSLAYFEQLHGQQTFISSIQTLLIVALIFLFILNLKNHSPTLNLLISHLLTISGMILMWEGGIFHAVSLPGEPGHWLTLMTILTLATGLLTLFYWLSHRQNYHPAIAINATAPDSQRRIFATALREHLDTPDSPLTDQELARRVLATFEAVLPGIPTMVLLHQHHEWHITPGEKADYAKTVDNLSRQLPTLEGDLLNVIHSGTHTKINFKDRFGTVHWVFPLDNEADKKVLMVLVPLRQYRNATTWQTACDLSSHACTLFRANRQSLFWQQQASLDPLTGLLNRRAFHREAEHIIQASVSHGFTPPCCALFMDLDNFKQLNDQQGHTAGDLVLSNTARLCRKALRQKDLLGRYGGEEFVALLPDTEPWQAFRVAERIRNTLAGQPVDKNRSEAQQTLTVSIGIAALSHQTSTLDKLVAEADTAMYQAKHRGKNRTCVSGQLTNDIRLPTT